MSALVASDFGGSNILQKLAQELEKLREDPGEDGAVWGPDAALHKGGKLADQLHNIYCFLCTLQICPESPLWSTKTRSIQERTCGTYTQWNITQPLKGTKLCHLQRCGWS